MHRVVAIQHQLARSLACTTIQAHKTAASIPNHQDSVKNENDLRRIACTIAGWEVDPSSIQLKEIKGGITNKLTLCTRTDTKQKVLVRVYGENTEVLIDRNIENRIFAELTVLKFGVSLLGQFANGRVEEWLTARTLVPDDIANPVLSAMCARRLCDLHAQPISGDRSPVLFPTIWSWLQIAKDCQFTDPAKARKVQALNLDRIERELVWLEGELKSVASPIVFAHNDALAGNILLDSTSDEPRMELIDMEYGGYNTRGFDIGNHFCEFAGFDYGKIRDKYPNKAQQYHFFHAYLSYAKGSSAVIANSELDAMFVEVNKYALASHLFWGLWAVVQASVSKIDFDYMEYGRQRLDAYFMFKPEFAAL